MTLIIALVPTSSLGTPLDQKYPRWVITPQNWQDLTLQTFPPSFYSLLHCFNQWHITRSNFVKEDGGSFENSNRFNMKTDLLIGFWMHSAVPPGLLMSTPGRITPCKLLRSSQGLTSLNTIEIIKPVSQALPLSHGAGIPSHAADLLESSKMASGNNRLHMLGISFNCKLLTGHHFSFAYSSHAHLAAFAHHYIGQPDHPPHLIGQRLPLGGLNMALHLIMVPEGVLPYCQSMVSPSANRIPLMSFVAHLGRSCFDQQWAGTPVPACLGAWQPCSDGFDCTMLHGCVRHLDQFQTICICKVQACFRRIYLQA